MGLRKINALRSRLLPNKGHSIKAEDTDSVVEMSPNDFNELNEKIVITKIEINLIMSKSTPNMLSSRWRLSGPQK